MKTNHHGKGDRHAQNKRRRERIQSYKIPRMKDPVYLIDGNITWHPVAFCKGKHAYLTVGLLEVHKCSERSCIHLERIYHHE